MHGSTLLGRRLQMFRKKAKEYLQKHVLETLLNGCNYGTVRCAATTAIYTGGVCTTRNTVSHWCTALCYSWERTSSRIYCLLFVSWDFVCAILLRTDCKPRYTCLLCVVPTVRPRKIVSFGMLSAVRGTSVVLGCCFSPFTLRIYLWYYCLPRAASRVAPVSTTLSQARSRFVGSLWCSTGCLWPVLVDRGFRHFALQLGNKLWNFAFNFLESRFKNVESHWIMLNLSHPYDPTLKYLTCAHGRVKLGPADSVVFCKFRATFPHFHWH